MPMFNKKPILIEARQFTGSQDSAQAIKAWVNSYRASGVSINEPHEPTALAIYTLEGVMKVSPGDWIIKGVRGEFYPCKPDIFDATYEKVEDDSWPE